jgi:DNA invertase Pin-like site-specific DNA recombinase
VRAIAYCRVSLEKQAVRGLSLEAQKSTIAAEVERRGWELVDVAGDTASGKSTRRSGLIQAIRKIEAGEADALVVARLDRLSRNMADFGDLLNRADKGKWALVVMDPPVDLTTPFGRAMAGMGAVFAQLERELIAQRTREGIAAKIAAGGRHGAPRQIPPEVERTIMRAHKRGRSARKIARQLDAEGVPTVRGGPWAPHVIEKVIARNQ